jgi:hypothetical protein
MSAAAAMRLTQLHRNLRAVAGVRWPDERWFRFAVLPMDGGYRRSIGDMPWQVR